eukprot:TRINITY_DN8239_c0_g1_i2.p1 TRINITY_DN8239_c0_g1~~TRINITY_DN8239_c0_g1_i2.p1  ORF type:complete len:286 (+),score=55.64 TRINITY_DN8239_c0_g1_i2:67-924(+)
MLVLMLDEIDFLLTRDQSVLYNLLQWTTYPDSNLVVIGISNTLDFADRLMARVHSRMGDCRIAFQPYTHQQLAEIVMARLKSLPVCPFHPDALEKMARKIASLSGDARRTLQVCRRALEICERELAEAQRQGVDMLQEVQMKHADMAIREFQSSPLIDFMQRMALHQQLGLVSLMHLQRINSVQEVLMKDVFGRYHHMCSMQKIGPTSWTDFSRICYELDEVGLIKTMAYGPGGRGTGSSVGKVTTALSNRLGPLVGLRVRMDDIVYALQEIPIVSEFVKIQIDT